MHCGILCWQPHPPLTPCFDLSRRGGGSREDRRAVQRQRRAAASKFFDEEAGVSGDELGSSDEDGDSDDDLEGFIVATAEATPSACTDGRPSVTPSSR